MSNDDDENMQAELTRRVTRGGVTTRTTTKGGKKSKTKKEGELTMMRTGNTQNKKGGKGGKGAKGKGAWFQRCWALFTHRWRREIGPCVRIRRTRAGHYRP